MIDRNGEKLLKVIEEREKTFRERLENLGSDDKITLSTFSELMGLEEAFEIVSGMTVVEYTLMKDFFTENKEEEHEN